MQKHEFENRWLQACDLTTCEREVIIDHFINKNRKIKGMGSLAKLGADLQTKFITGLRLLVCRPLIGGMKNKAEFIRKK